MSTTCASSLRLKPGMNLVIVFITNTLLLSLQLSEMAVLGAEIPTRKITCHAGTVLAGQNASVTCNFPTNVAADKNDVIVGRLPVNASKDAIWVDTLVCGWKDSKQPYRCDVTKDFRFDGVISDYLTLHIPDVGIDKAGMYICFIVSSDIPSAECELAVKENQPLSPETKNENSTSNPHNEKDKCIMLYVLISILNAMLLGILVGLFIAVWCRFSRFRQVRRKPPLAENSYEPMSTRLLIATQLPNKKVLEFLKLFELSTTDCEQIRERLHEEMEDCKRRIQCSSDDTDKSHEGDKQARHKMYSVPLKRLPTETVTERDGISVVEISNTILRIHNVSLQVPQPNTTCTNYPIPKDTRQGTGYQLLDFIADCVKKCHRLKVHRKKLLLGFVFSFPCEYQHDLTRPRFTSWNSGFRLDDLVGKDVQKLLCEAFCRKHPKSCLKVTIILSNAAGILLSQLNKDQNCRIGVSLADSFHACYLQRENCDDTHNAEDNRMITNIVLGAFGDTGCLNEFITEFDKELDLHSVNPGKQILDKMVSVRFIGETVRLVMTTLAKKGLLFSSDPSRSLLNKKDSFTADYVSLIQSDRSKQFLLTDYVLRQLEIERYTIEDCRTVSSVVETVLTRAAHLAATVLAVLVNQTNAIKVTIAVEGDFSHYHPIYLGLLRDKTEELVKSEKEVEFKASYHASAIGAALAVNVPMSSHAVSPPLSSEP